LTITKDMPIGEVVQKYPATIAVFLRHGLMCFACPGQGLCHCPL